MKRFISTLLAVVLISSFFIISVGDVAASKKGWPKGVAVAGGGLGGTYYTWAIGWSKILSTKMDLSANVEVTSGPVANFKLIDSNQVDFGLITVGPAWEGLNGTGWSEGKQYYNVRAMFPSFPAYMQWLCPAKSSFKTIKDFKNKTVCVGPSGTTSATYAGVIFKFLEIEPKKIIYASFSEATNLMQDGMIDAGLFVGGIPFPAVSEYSVTEKAIVGGFSSGEMAKIVKKYPYFGTSAIPANTYKGQDRDVSTLTMWNAMFANKNLSEDFVYNLLKKTFENVDIVISAHKSAKHIKLENVKFISGVPLHVGAIKYYKEKNIHLPESAYPPEYQK